MCKTHVHPQCMRAHRVPMMRSSLSWSNTLYNCCSFLSTEERPVSIVTSEEPLLSRTFWRMKNQLVHRQCTVGMGSASQKWNHNTRTRYLVGCSSDWTVFHFSGLINHQTSIASYFFLLMFTELNMLKHACAKTVARASYILADVHSLPAHAKFSP